MTKSRLTKAQRIDLLERYARGEKVAAIAALFGVTSSYVSRFARITGTPLRRPNYRRAHV